jgi:hypothetical protein
MVVFIRRGDDTIVVRNYCCLMVGQSMITLAT